jgi:hypothetical protein
MIHRAKTPLSVLTSLVVLSMLSTLACEANDPVGDEAASTADTETSETADEEVCELWEFDATYPGDCACAAPGEACVQGCTKPDGVQTCADVCAALGETCVENACDGGTYVGATDCPAPGEYGGAMEHACDEPVPVSDNEDFGVSCCCTRD